MFGINELIFCVMFGRYVVEYCSPKRKDEHVLHVQLKNQTSGTVCRFYFDATEFKPNCHLGITMPQLYNFGCISEEYYRVNAGGSCKKTELVSILLCLLALTILTLL